MAETTGREVRTSKRKRAQVNYYEDPVTDDETSDIPGEEEEEEDDIDEACRTKKRTKVVPSKPLPKKKIFPFLELPAEIRNEIYSLCLHDPAGVYLFSTTQKFRRTVFRGTEASFRGSPPPSYSQSSNGSNGEDGVQAKPCNEYRPLVPALLAVCKQINAEARDILWDHKFYVQDTLALHSFLVDLGPLAARNLKDITLGGWGMGRGVHKAYNHACFTALSAATNLERFTFHGALSYSNEPKAVATIFYRDAFPWLEAVGATKGQADAAVDLICVRTTTNTWSRWRSNKYHYEEYPQMTEFRQTLSKLLNARMSMIRA